MLDLGCGVQDVGFDLETASPRLHASEDPSSRMRARTCTGGERQLAIPVSILAASPFLPTRLGCDTDNKQKSWQQQSKAESLALVRHTTIPSTMVVMLIMVVRTTTLALLEILVMMQQQP